MDKKKALTTSILISTAMLLGSQAFAGQLCQEKGVLTGTDYFVPRKDVPSTYAMYRSFSSAVRVEGSGVLSNGSILHYNGIVTKRACDKINGEWAVVGSGKRCLIPFISVAADNSIYPPGTIIAVRELRGEKLQVTVDGQTMIHPGFFIVDDTGGAIKGKGRFDFYTGALAENDRKNAFGYYGKFGMGVSVCNKHYRAIFRDKAPDSDYQKALKAIEEISHMKIHGVGDFD